MATTEKIIGRFGDGRMLVRFTQAGPASYAPPGISVTINALKTVEHVISLDNDGGFRDSPQEAEGTLSTNTFTLGVHYHGYACPGTSSGGLLAGTACAEGFGVNSGVNLSAFTFSGMVSGF